MEAIPYADLEKCFSLSLKLDLRVFRSSFFIFHFVYLALICSPLPSTGSGLQGSVCLLVCDQLS